MKTPFLSHYGVKGMKWGVRKRDQKKLRQPPSDDARTAHRAFVKSKISGVEALSNRELRALNDRLTLEMNYSRLSYQPSRLQKGMDAVGGMLKVGKRVDEVVQFAKTDTGKKLASTLQSNAKKAKKAASTTT